MKSKKIKSCLIVLIGIVGLLIYGCTIPSSSGKSSGSNNAGGSYNNPANIQFAVTSGSLVVNDTANAASWSIQSNIQVGNTMYGDRTFTIATLPAVYAGLQWIRTANASKAYTTDPIATFTVTTNSDIFVALDDRTTTKPSWLSGWTDTGDNMTDNEGSSNRTFNLLKKSYTANSTISLGNAGSTNDSFYIVLIKDTSSSSSSSSFF